MARSAQLRRRLSPLATILAVGVSAAVAVTCWVGSTAPRAAPSTLRSNVLRQAAVFNVPGDLKNGARIVVEGAPWVMEGFMSKRQGKGVGITKATMKNLLTGTTKEWTLPSGSKYDYVETEWKSGTYSFFDPDSAEFVMMDSTTFEEFRVPVSVLGPWADWLTEGMEVDMESWNGAVMNIQVKGDLILEVKSIVMKKDNGSDSQVELSNGIVKQGPSYLEVGDKVLLSKTSFDIVKRL